MPVVKNFDFDKHTAPPPKAPAAPIERVTMMEGRDSAFDRPEPIDEGVHAGVGLYVWLFIIAGVVLRLMLAALGPATDPTLIVTDRVAYQQALAETMVDHHTFGRPLIEADVVTPTFDTPHTLDEAALRVEQLRRVRGETAGVYTEGIKPESAAMPGIPALLAAFTLTGLPLNVLVLVQCVIGGLLAWPAFIAVGGIVKARAPAALAAALVALHPAMVTASLTLDGTLWVATAVILALLAITPLINDSALRAAGGGFALGLASLIQPWTLFAAPVIVMWRVLFKRNASSFALAGFFLAASAAPPAAWMYRNAGFDAGWVLTTDARVDRAFGVPAAMKVHDPGSDLRNDRPAAIASLWDEFTTQAKEAGKQGETTTQTLRSFALSQAFGEPVQAARYLSVRARTLLLDHSAESLLPAMGLTYESSGYLAGLIGEATNTAEPDPVARWITEAWIGLNLVVLAAAVMGVVVCAVRRNVAVVLLVLGVGAAWLVFAPSWIGEEARLPIFVIQAVAITALWMPAPPKKVKAPKHKVGDFDFAVPEAGFVIGPRGAAEGPDMTLAGMHSETKPKAQPDLTPVSSSDDDDDLPRGRPI